MHGLVVVRCRRHHGVGPARLDDARGPGPAGGLVLLLPEEDAGTFLLATALAVVVLFEVGTEKEKEERSLTQGINNEEDLNHNLKVPNQKEKPK